MPRIFAVVVLFMLCVSSAVSQTQSADPRLMSDADYKTLLSQVETALPKWKTALKNIDPEKSSQVSYAVGKLIIQSRDTGLTEIEYIPSFAASQRQKRTVYGELAISRFLESLYDSVEEEVAAEAVGNVTLSHLENYAPELSTFQMRLYADAMARAQLLEKGTCLH